MLLTRFSYFEPAHNEVFAWGEGRGVQHKYVNNQKSLRGWK